MSHSVSCTHALVKHQAQRPQSRLRLLQVSKCNTNCGVSTVCVIIRHRNSSPASEFKEFRLKLWDHKSLFLEFYIFFLKTPWKACSEAVNQGQMDSVFRVLHSVCVFAQVWKASISSFKQGKVKQNKLRGKKRQRIRELASWTTQVIGKSDFLIWVPSFYKHLSAHPRVAQIPPKSPWSPPRTTKVITYWGQSRVMT